MRTKHYYLTVQSDESRRAREALKTVNATVHGGMYCDGSTGWRFLIELPARVAPVQVSKACWDARVTWCNVRELTKEELEAIS